MAAQTKMLACIIVLAATRAWQDTYLCGVSTGFRVRVRAKVTCFKHRGAEITLLVEGVVFTCDTMYEVLRRK